MPLDSFFDDLRSVVDPAFPGDSIIRAKFWFASGKEFDMPIPAQRHNKPAVESAHEANDPLPRFSRLRRVIMRAIEDAGKRLTLTQLQEAVAQCDQEYSDRHLKNVLGDLEQDELVDNKKDGKGKGYGLVTWPGGE